MRTRSLAARSLLLALVLALPLAGLQPASAGPVKKKKVASVGYLGDLTGGPFINSGSVHLTAKVRTKKNGKRVVKRVKSASVGRVYLYCDGTYVTAPTDLFLKGVKVKGKTFRIAQKATWLSETFDVVLEGRFIGKKAKRAKGTASVKTTTRCGDAGSLVWTATRQ